MPRGHALVVDDSSTARILLARLLERANITTKSVASAEEALSRLENEQFDIIFLDHLLPGMNGFEALEAIKNNPETRDTPVFMYTSQNAERYLSEAKARGAAGVIGKQVSRDQLLQTLEDIFAGKPELNDQEFFPEEVLALGSAEPVQTRRLTGRLATLEIAYEETHDELRQLRQTMIRMELSHQENLHTNQRRMKWVWVTTCLGFTVVAVLLGLQVTELSVVIEGVNKQLSVMQEMINNLVDLVER
ncbi:MAG: response regulator [Marinobacter sp.]|uniref:response regulator n=1 Tax=Marinobacter sp. TaxID=50741 RepID=UPI0034A015E4